MLHLRSGQSLYGRSHDFKTIPEIPNRPKIIGSLRLSNATRLEHVELLNKQHQRMGIEMAGIEGVLLKNISIDSLEQNGLRYQYGVSIKNSRHIQMEKLLVNIAGGIDESIGGRAIYLENSKEITLRDSTLILRDHDKPVWGIYQSGGSLVAEDNNILIEIEQLEWKCHKEVT